MTRNEEKEASPLLIRGANGLPVGVVSPSRRDQENVPYNNAGPKERGYGTGNKREQASRVPSSVLKATAVRKTATTKKKGAEARDAKMKVMIAGADEDILWRPLGAAFMGEATGGDGGDGGGGDGGGCLLMSPQMTPLLQPPRLSQEVQPVNLQGLFEDSSVNTFSKVHVYVRIRPDTTGRALGQTQNPCLRAQSAARLAISAPLGSLAYKNGDCYAGQVMAFNRVFGPETSQVEYYTQTSKSLVEQLVQRERFEGVFLSYGITSSGKTYTIQGTKESPGIIPMSLQTLFGKLVDSKETNVEISYCEIYNEAIYDLLGREGGAGGGSSQARKRPPLRLMEARDGSIMVDKLSWVRVEHPQEAWNVLRRGMKQRKRATTKLNYSSSRSHSVCSIRLTNAMSGKTRKLSFVDLAGSERAHRTGITSTGPIPGTSCLGGHGTVDRKPARLKEAVAINGSLMTLGRCLEALRYNQRNKTTSQVIPYRESKVTHMFRDALHGYGTVVLSVNVSVAPEDFDETLRVLKYATTASQIATTAAKPVKPGKVMNSNQNKLFDRSEGLLHVHSDVDVSSREEKAAGVRGARFNRSVCHVGPGSGSQAASPTKQGRLRKETPLGLKRHRQMMEMERKKVADNPEVSVSIDSRIHGASPSPLLPQLLCEEEIDNLDDMTSGKMEIIQEEDDISSSSYEETAEDEQADEEDGGVTMRGGKPVRSFSEDAKASERDVGHASKRSEETNSTIAILESKLKAAEEKLLEMEMDVRDEVATEMAQIIDTVEETYKRQIEDDAKAAEARFQALEAKHKTQLAGLEATVESQQLELDELRASLGDLERRAHKRRKKVAAAEKEADRYKDALNDALAEIEKLHGIIEQEEEANAKLAASLSEILQEQSLPDSPDTNLGNTEDRDDQHEAAVAKIRRIRREVTQIAANNAMEKDMSEHLIERLKKDNEVLRSKLVAMTRAIETCCTPSRDAIMQNLVVACPAGLGRGASGTPHEVALARARGLVDSPVTDDSPKESIKSRFAKEIVGDSPKTVGGKLKPSVGGLQVVGESDEVHLLDSLDTPIGDKETPEVKVTVSKEAVPKSTPPSPTAEPCLRRSPRKHLSTTKDDFKDERKSQGADYVEEERDPLPELEPQLPKTTSRITRRARNKYEDSSPAAARKTRKLLSTAKKQPPTRILGVSNSTKRNRRLGGMPTAESLGLKSKSP